MTIGNVRGLPFSYSSYGEGPPLVFIMGLSGSQHHWYDWPQRFEGAHRVVTFDHRGMGASAYAGGTSIASMCEDTIALLDELGMERAHLLGVSMGGMVAQEIALRHPSRVDRLILGCSHAGGTTQIAPTSESMARLQRGGRSRAERARSFLRVCHTPEFLREHAEEAEAMVSYAVAHPVPDEIFYAQVAAVIDHDCAERLGLIEHRTLVLSGEADELIPWENSRILAAGIRHSSLITWPQVGHVFWKEAPEKSAQAVLAFLSEGAHPATDNR